MIRLLICLSTLPLRWSAIPKLCGKLWKQAHLRPYTCLHSSKCVSSNGPQPSLSQSALKLDLTKCLWKELTMKSISAALLSWATSCKVSARRQTRAWLKKFDSPWLRGEETYSPMVWKLRMVGKCLSTRSLLSHLVDLKIMVSTEGMPGRRSRNWLPTMSMIFVRLESKLTQSSWLD